MYGFSLFSLVLIKVNFAFLSIELEGSADHASYSNVTVISAWYVYSRPEISTKCLNRPQMTFEITFKDLKNKDELSVLIKLSE